MSINQTLADWQAQDLAVRKRLGAPSPIPRHKLVSLSGMQLFEAMLAGELPAPPIGETLDFIPVHMSLGEAVYQGKPLLHHYNPLGYGPWRLVLHTPRLCLGMRGTHDFARGQGLHHA